MSEYANSPAGISDCEARARHQAPYKLTETTILKGARLAYFEVNQEKIAPFPTRPALQSLKAKKARFATATHPNQ